MVYIQDNISVKDIFDNIEYYTDLFLEHGILIFKKLNPTRQEEWDLMKSFGDRIGWFPNSTVEGEPRSPYLSTEDEGHQTTFNRFDHAILADELFIDWHIERAERENFQTGALWHMRKFECDPDSGQTGFINMISLFEHMPKDWQDFLIKCKVCSLSQPNELGVFTDVEFSESLPQRYIVISHYSNKKPIYRPSLSATDFLTKVDDLPPSVEDLKLFEEIRQWTIDQTVDSPNNQTWFKWSVGDTMIIDLSLMAHAVKGGFNLGERSFSRIWAHRYSSDIIE